MSGFIQQWAADYWIFLSRRPSVKLLTVVEETPEFYYNLVGYAAIFVVLNLSTPIILKHFFPTWYNGLDAQKRSQVPAYISCLAHHAVNVPWAWREVIREWNLSAHEGTLVNFPLLYSSGAQFFMGYTVADTLTSSIQEALEGKFELLVHHFFILSITMTAASFGDGGIARYITHLLLLDTTNLFFNSAWLLRTMGLRDSALVLTLELLFAFFFLIFRAAHLPCFIGVVLTSNEVESLGYAKYILVLFVLLQWYWFQKVVTGIYLKIRALYKNKDKES